MTGYKLTGILKFKKLFSSLCSFWPYPIALLALSSAWIATRNEAFSKQIIDWIATKSFRWAALATSCSIVGGMLYWIVRSYRFPLPTIRVVVTSGKTMMIRLKEKKYLAESYWSGDETEISGEHHQLAICLPVSAAGVMGQQITISSQIISSKESIAQQFNELLRQHKIQPQ